MQQCPKCGSKRTEEIRERTRQAAENIVRDYPKIKTIVTSNLRRHSPWWKRAWWKLTNGGP